MATSHARLIAEIERLTALNEALTASNAALTAELTEARASVSVLSRDVKILGPENVKLSNAFNAARAEIFRLKTPKARGRPPKEKFGGTYEDILYRHASQLITKSMGPGRTKLNEKQAAIQADKDIRKTAESLQNADMPGAFVSLSPSYAPSEADIYRAFRRGKDRFWRGTSKPNE